MAEIAVQIIYRRIQNYSPSRQGHRPEAIVIHMSGGSAAATWQTFNDPAQRNSAHYLITRAGEIWRLVEETDTAWHAGGAHKPTWKLVKSNISPNYYTIGIALEGEAGDTWSDSMYTATALLLSSISARWDIPLDRDHVIGHSEINVQQTDPGLSVDFERLLNQAKDTIQDFASHVHPAESSAEAYNQLTLLQLNLAALQAENKKLKSQMSKLDPDKYSTLQKQNVALAEDLYQAQERSRELKNKLDKLQSQHNSLVTQRQTQLEQFSTRELLSGIIKKIWGKFSP